MTTERVKSVEESLRSEVMERNSSAAAGFIVVAALCYYTELFLPRLNSLETALCLLIMTLNLVRLGVSYVWRRDRQRLDSLWWPLCGLIWVNSALWGWLLALGNWLNWYPSVTFALVMLIITGYGAASIFTLSLFGYLLTPFTLAMCAPQVAIALWRYQGLGDPLALPVMIYILTFVFYIIQQSANYRRRFKEKIIADLSLLQSQADLIENQKKLLMQQAAIEQSNRLASVGEMAAGFAHEVNNPLAIISVSLSLLRNILENSPEGLSHVDRSNRAVERITKIIKGLRNLSRPDLSEGKTSQSAQGLAEEVLGFCQAKLSSAGIRLHTSFAPDLVVPCRPIQVSQILLNLINNACDAMESLPAQVARLIELRTYTREGMVYFEVSNAGPPLGPELRQKIFMPFFTTKEVGKGTGLGLPLSRSMAQAHGGDLYLDETAASPTFVLKLPA